MLSALEIERMSWEWGGVGTAVKDACGKKGLSLVIIASVG